MPKRRIAIFGYSDSVHIQRWAEGLQRRGNEVRVISCGGSPIEDIDTVVLSKFTRLSYLTQGARARSAAEEFRPDIVHAHYAASFGWWARKFDYCPTIVSVWGSDAVQAVDSGWRRWMLRKVLTSANLVTATSRYLAGVTRGVVPSLVGKIEVVPFSSEFPKQARPEPLEDPIKICFIKAHSAVYGPEVLIEAMALVHKHLPEVRLSIAGQGPLTSRLTKMVEKLGLENHVEFPGQIDFHKLSDYIQDHHMMVMPSLAESFGVAVLDASACARPVIASDVGGVKEVLRDGRTGLLVPPGDVEYLAAAILRLASEPELRRGLGEEGRRFVLDRYSWDSCLDKMTALYERLIDGHKKA